MKNLFLFSLISLSLISSSAQDGSADRKMIYGSPVDGVRYFNPILPDFVADPSLVMFNGIFYLYGTTDINRGLEKMGPPVVWKSHDFVNWSFEGTLVPSIDWDKPYSYTDTKGKQRTGYFRYWAPGKPIERNGKYYLFPTIVKPDESMGTYVMVADRPEGPFAFVKGDGLYLNEMEKQEREAKPIVGDIDGEPFVDEDGRCYIFWRRRNAAEMVCDFSGIIGDPIQIKTRFGGYSEGPVMFKRQGIYYYIYTLSGNANYCNGYMMSHKSPLGPFETPGGQGIFIYSDLGKGIWGPGHGNVFQMPGTSDFYFLYLEYGEGGTTRQVFIDKMEFEEDGTIQHQKLSFEGVGFLKEVDQRKNIAKGARVNASSVMPEKEVSAIIAPDPNILNGAKVNETNGQKVSRWFSYKPSHVVDESNGSCWRALPDDKEPWLMIDLGKKQKVASVEMAFTLPTYGHAWILEKSFDGKTWSECSRQDEVKVCSPHVAKIKGKARYLRIRILKGEPGVWEVKIY